MSHHVGDSNIEAYQIMAEILVTVRKIVHRGLERAAGKTWYLDGCPPGVYERLVARKENEVAIDRFDREYQELISFASLDDLAEIIEYNEELAHLLERIAPEGATVAERFRQIETLRLKLDAAVPLSDEDLDNLLLYHDDVRRSLARPKTTAEPEEEPEPLQDVEAEAEVVEISEDEGSEVSEDFGTQVTEAEELGVDDVVTDEPSDAFGTAVVDSGVIETPPAAGDPDETAVAVERAMASDDDDEVLRILHREIMSVAEHVLKGDVDQEFPVWQTLKTSGWYGIKQTALSISPVERFYSIAEELCAKNRDGASTDEIKKFVSESEAGKLVLSLGEMFKKHKL